MNEIIAAIIIAHPNWMAEEIVRFAKQIQSETLKNHSR